MSAAETDLVSPSTSGPTLGPGASSLPSPPPKKQQQHQHQQLPHQAHTFACVRCSERKVKCDRQDPCNACVRHSAECIFRAPKPPRRRRHQGSREETVGLLKRYEELLRRNGIDPGMGGEYGGSGGAGGVTGGTDTVESPNAGLKTTSSHGSGSPAVQGGAGEEFGTAAHLPTPASTTFSETKQFFKPQLLHGQSGTKLADNSLWSRVAQEMRDADDSLDEDDSTDEATETGEQPLSVFPPTGHVSAPVHPPPAVIKRLCKIFFENVNPMFKFIHAPTFQQALEKAIANLDHVPRQFEALMFGVYATAVLSLPAEDCKREFGTSHQILLRRYTLATQKALSRAKFMSTTSLLVLQALLLYLITIRTDQEPRAVWNLTGLVVRIAEGMGMRLDGTQLGLPPFESEMRRRLWWQITVHDFRCAEMCGQAKVRLHDPGAPDPPSNLNDGDLYPGMPTLPDPVVGATEMLWVMFRTELSSFMRGQLQRMKNAGVGPGVSPEEFLIMDDLDYKDRLVKQVEDVMETKHVRFCDPTQPLHLFTLLAMRSAIKLMWFMCHHPRRWAHLPSVPLQEQQQVWEHALSILEYYQMMQTSPILKPFQWNVPYFLQWHVIIHILDTLRMSPARGGAERAWELIDSIYENNGGILLSTNRPVFMAVGNLCLKAVDAREAAWGQEGRGRVVWKEYVGKLREQREAARLRRAAAAARARGGQVAENGGQAAKVEAQDFGANTQQIPTGQGQEGATHQQLQQQPPYSDTYSLTTNSTTTNGNGNGTNQQFFTPQPPQNPTTTGLPPHNPYYTATAPDPTTDPNLFWLTNATFHFDNTLGFGMGNAGPVDAEMMDFDHILAQGYSLDVAPGESGGGDGGGSGGGQGGGGGFGAGGVDWAQWDSFFGGEGGR